MEEFLRAPIEKGMYKWAIGNTLEVVADNSIGPELLDVVRDKRHGIARQMIVMALGRLKCAGVVKVLVELLEDDDVVGHAIAALKKQKAIGARKALERLLNHDRAWIRREARKTLQRFDEIEGRVELNE